MSNHHISLHRKKHSRSQHVHHQPTLGLLQNNQRLQNQLNQLLAKLLAQQQQQQIGNAYQPEPGFIVCPNCANPSQIDKKTCKAFVLDCIDFRLRDNIQCNLTNLGYKNNYDEFVAAGASLGYVGLNSMAIEGTGEPTFPVWYQMIDEHIKVAYDLHLINTLIIVDHMGCGAYSVAYTDLSLNTQEEYDLHIKNLNNTAELLLKKFGQNGSVMTIPNLVIKKYIIALNGGQLIDIDQYIGEYPF
jgi:hypothetical protein